MAGGEPWERLGQACAFAVFHLWHSGGGWEPRSDEGVQVKARTAGVEGKVGGRLLAWWGPS